VITQADLVDCLSLAVAVFPQYPLTQAQVLAYHELIGDLDITKGELFQAVSEVLKASKFFPTVAEIRAELTKKPTNSPPQFNALEYQNVEKIPMPDYIKQQLASIIAKRGLPDE
jgi:hypothetical protein